MSLMDRLIAAALTGAVLGAAGCASTAAQGEPTTPATGDNAGCNCAGSCEGPNSCHPDGAGGDKMSCKSGHGCHGMAPADAAATPAAPAPAAEAPAAP